MNWKTILFIVPVIIIIIIIIKYTINQVILQGITAQKEQIINLSDYKISEGVTDECSYSIWINVSEWDNTNKKIIVEKMRPANTTFGYTGHIGSVNLKGPSGGSVDVGLYGETGTNGFLTQFDMFGNVTGVGFEATTSGIDTPSLTGKDVTLIGKSGGYSSFEITGETGTTGILSNFGIFGNITGVEVSGITSGYDYSGTDGYEVGSKNIQNNIKKSVTFNKGDFQITKTKEEEEIYFQLYLEKEINRLGVYLPELDYQYQSHNECRITTNPLDTIKVDTTNDCQQYCNNYSTNGILCKSFSFEEDIQKCMIYTEKPSMPLTCFAEQMSLDTEMHPYDWNEFIYNSDYFSGTRTSACTISNIPLQEWTNIIVTIKQMVMSLFLNGKLVKTCMLYKSINTPSQTKGMIIITPDNNGFQGKTRQFKYWNKCLTEREIKNIYDNK